MKKFLFLVSSLCCVFALSFPVVSAEVASDTTSEVSSDTTTTTNTTTATLGHSDFTFNISVDDNNLFHGLETLLSTYTTEVYAPSLTVEGKALLTKALTSLVVSVVIGDASYTLDTFLDAFTKILAEYGILVTDDVLDAITQYAVHYLEDDLEQDETDIYLAWVGSSLGMMVTLFITSQMGGVHRA